MRLRLLALRLLPPLLLLAAIWWPEWTHYRIDRSPFQGPLPAAQPEALLQEIADFDLAEAEHGPLSREAAMRAIDSGIIEVPALGSGRLPLRGYPDDLQSGPPTYQLFMGGLSLERVLLGAWRETGERRWLIQALTRTLQLSAHEAGRRHDQGFLWNDHAVASRPAVLIALWAALQQDAGLRERHGAELLSFVLRTGRMLASPRQFTVRTNHGVMQNIALLQLSAAFADLPEARAWRELADRQLRLQLGFYVSPEGVVLEHSAGYHALGTQLIGMAQRLRVLNGLPADTQLDRLVPAARQVLDGLLRSDRTLPAIGNTDGHVAYPLPTGGGAQRLGQVAPAATLPASRLYPIAGWGIWWSGAQRADGSQLMLSWALHPGHGHKHADEGAFTWWARGQDWLTAVGYWNYGDARTRASYEWPAANALHAPGETLRTPRQARLLASGEVGDLRFAAVERQRLDEPGRFQRQWLQLDADTLLVLDFHAGSAKGAQGYWSFGTQVQLHALSPDWSQWSSRPNGQGWRLLGAHDGALRAERWIGDERLAAGWTTVQRQPVRVDSLKLHSGASEGASASLLQLSREDLTLRLRLQPGASPEHWTLSWQRGDAPARQVQRDGLTLRLGELQLALQAAAPAATQPLRDSYSRAVASYPPWRNLWRYRVEVSQWLLGLLVAAEAGWLLLRRRLAARGWQGPAALLIAAGWALAAWLVLGIHLRA